MPIRNHLISLHITTRTQFYLLARQISITDSIPTARVPKPAEGRDIGPSQRRGGFSQLRDPRLRRPVLCRLRLARRRSREIRTSVGGKYAPRSNSLGCGSSTQGLSVATTNSNPTPKVMGPGRVKKSSISLCVNTGCRGGRGRRRLIMGKDNE